MMTEVDLKRVDTRIKAKEFFTIELDHETNTLTFTVNGEVRNIVKTFKAESLFERMLKIAKFKFLKMRDATKKETIVIDNYQKYWINDTAQGHLIKICHGTNGEQVTELDLRWPNRKRDSTNRVMNEKIKST